LKPSSGEGSEPSRPSRVRGGPHGQSDVHSLGPQDVQRLDALLTTFVAESQVKCALLLDRTGRLLTTGGDVAGLDGTSFASLAAADFAASDQLAVLLGEQEFSALYHAGDKSSMYLADIVGIAVLATMFDGRTTLGMVRLKTKILVPKLAELITELASRVQTRQPQLDGLWLSDAVDEIDRLFNL
jgi:predicted regulator of Ras-like GTPase activity (Roadblock/LC7/MglB family)